MSNVAPIATTKIAAGQGAQAPQALGGSSSGVFANGVAGANFWDIILSQLNFSGEAQAATPAATSTPAEAAKKPADKGHNPLAMLQVALASQAVDADGNIIVDAKAEKLQMQLGLTNKIIDFIKGATPDTVEQKGLLNNILSKLQTKSETLQASIAALESNVITKDTPVEDIPLPLLIALGLNPSEISQVTERIQELEEKLGREITVEDLIAGVGGLLPTQNNAVVTVVSVKKDGSAVLDSIDENSQPTDDLAAQLNALDVGGEEPAADDAKKPVKAEGEEPAKLDVKADAKAEVKADVKADAKASFKDNLVNMFNDMKTQAGQMIFPIASFGGDIDAALYQPYGLNATPSLSFGSTAQAANLVSANVSAGHTHPATQMVAAQISRSAKDGVDTMTLRLDPPELGNVNVRLQFGKDKTVKAHITVEKPETFMMLSRDGHALERALQTAGLDTGNNGEAISFELAQDNSAFGHDNDAQGGGEKTFGGGASGSQNAGMDGDIVQSSMTWHIDPSTGHVRYNIFA